MRVVVTGASGNVGMSLLPVLAADDRIDEIVGLARRKPSHEVPKTEWRSAYVERSDLESIFEGADCVVHLAWAVQPSHDLAALRQINVDGSERIFRAVAEADVPALVYASSVGAYSPGPKHRPVDESWPTDGTPTSFYARHKAEVENLLDHFQAGRPETRVVRLRPGLIFKRGSGEEQRRYFLGPLFPRILARDGAIAFVADIDGLRFIRERSSLPIVADESCLVSGDIPKLVGAVDGINIKLAKCGSLREAIRMVHVARAHGLAVMVGCMIESSLAITAAAHFTPLVDIVDLDGAALLKDDPFAGATIANGQVRLPDAPGLGVTRR